MTPGSLSTGGHWALLQRHVYWLTEPRRWCFLDVKGKTWKVNGYYSPSTCRTCTDGQWNRVLGKMKLSQTRSASKPLFVAILQDYEYGSFPCNNFLGNPLYPYICVNLFVVHLSFFILCVICILWHMLQSIKNIHTGHVICIVGGHYWFRVYWNNSATMTSNSCSHLALFAIKIEFLVWGFHNQKRSFRFQNLQSIRSLNDLIVFTKSSSTPNNVMTSIWFACSLM